MFSDEFLVNFGQDSLTVIRRYLSGIWCTRYLFLLCLIFYTGTGRWCSRAIFVSLLVSNSCGFWPLLLADNNRNERDILCSWNFFPILGCVFKVLLLTNGVQRSVPMALVIMVIEPNIRVKQPSNVNSSNKSTVHMISIGIFEGNLLLPYKSLPASMWLACTILLFWHRGTVNSGTRSMDYQV